jgi:hypothetical protein
MFTIEIIPDNDGFDVSLMLDGEYVTGATGWHKTPVEAAFAVRGLIEEYMTSGV